jgi:DNA-binding NtrC family response regulator
MTIELPPLRERREEIPLLAHHFLEKYSKQLDKEIAGITPQAMAVLEAHDWPGNVRELEHVVERAVLLADETVDMEDIPLGPGASTVDWADVPDDARVLAARKKEIRARSVDQLERLFVLKALHNAGGNVSEAARSVGMKRPNLHALMRKHDIEAPNSPGDDDAGDEDGGDDDV